MASSVHTRIGMQITPRNSFVDFGHARGANLMKVDFAKQALPRIHERASEGPKIVDHRKVTNTCRSPMAEGLLRMIAKSVGLTVEVRIIQNAPCWRASRLVDIPALW
jgi:hypothetical protein